MTARQRLAQATNAKPAELLAALTGAACAAAWVAFGWYLGGRTPRSSEPPSPG